jgi:hypothetical protein
MFINLRAPLGPRQHTVRPMVWREPDRFCRHAFSAPYASGDKREGPENELYPFCCLILDGKADCAEGRSQRAEVSWYILGRKSTAVTVAAGWSTIFTD